MHKWTVVGRRWDSASQTHGANDRAPLPFWEKGEILCQGEAERKRGTERLAAGMARKGKGPHLTRVENTV